MWNLQLHTFLDLHNDSFFQAEARAEFAERSVQKLQKEVDRLEGMYYLPIIFIVRVFSTISYHKRIGKLTQDDELYDNNGASAKRFGTYFNFSLIAFHFRVIQSSIY